MLLKTKKLPLFLSAVFILVIAFAIIAVACSGGEAGGKVNEDPDEEEIEIAKNYESGEDALNWGVSTSANVATLTLQPGDDTTKINLNWYSTGNTADKVAQVRFIRGTFAAGFELIEVTTGGTVAAASAGNVNHKVSVTGLKQGKSYQYAVSSDGTNWTAAYDFKVPAAEGSWKFAVIADPQLHQTNWDTFNRYQPTASVITTSTGSKTEQGWIETVQKIVAAGVSFIASGGDQVDTSASINENEYNSFFAPSGLRNLPFAPVAGNHDAHAAFDYHYNVPNPQSFNGEGENEPKRNYYYLYNRILFVVLNTAPYPGSQSAASAYIPRFRSTIQAAKTAHAGKYDWLIVQHHKSTASVAVHLADTDIQYYVEAGFETLMSEQGVDFVLAGHDHVYARSYPLQGLDGGKVSVPDKTTTSEDGHTVTNPGKPIYLTFTTASGLKYYPVNADPYFRYGTSGSTGLYVTNNTVYPYLGEAVNEMVDGTFKSSTFVGSTAWLNDKKLPVSNLTYCQPWIPSYTIVEVNGKTIKFSTYAIGSAYGTSPGADQAYSFDANTPYDYVTVTKN